MDNKNIEEIPLKTQVGLKFNSRSHDKIVKFSKWYHAQSNAQNSFFSMVEHMIDRFGYVDICDHEIAKKLHTEMLHFVNEIDHIQSIQSNTPTEVKNTPEPILKTQTTNDSKPQSKVNLQPKDVKGF